LTELAIAELELRYPAGNSPSIAGQVCTDGDAVCRIVAEFNDQVAVAVGLQ